MLKTCEKLECDVVGLQETFVRQGYAVYCSGVTCEKLECDVVGLQETFVRQGYAVYCSGVLTAGECNGEREQKGQQRGVALAVT